MDASENGRTANPAPPGERARAGRQVRHYRRSELERVRDPSGASYFAVALERSMLTYFEVPPHSSFPRHRHDSEQITLVLSGRLLFEVEGRQVEVGPGEVVALPGNVPHAVRSLEEPVTAVDAWSPPRADYSAPRPRRRGAGGDVND